MTEPLDSLSMYDLNWRIAFLMEEKDHLREEMLKAREHVSENFNNRIIAAYLRQLIDKINIHNFLAFLVNIFSYITLKTDIML